MIGAIVEYQNIANSCTSWLDWCDYCSIDTPEYDHYSFAMLLFSSVVTQNTYVVQV